MQNLYSTFNFYFLQCYIKYTKPISKPTKKLIRASGRPVVDGTTNVQKIRTNTFAIKFANNYNITHRCRMNVCIHNNIIILLALWHIYIITHRATIYIDTYIRGSHLLNFFFLLFFFIFIILLKIHSPARGWFFIYIGYYSQYEKEDNVLMMMMIIIIIVVYIYFQ